MPSDNTIQTITIQNSPSYSVDWENMVEFVKENLPSYIEQHPEQFDKFFDNIIQKVQDENLHHPCLSIDLGQEYDNDQPKHPNLKQVSVKFTTKSKCPYVISFLIEDAQGVRTATLQHILYGKQIQHLTKESTSHWLLLPEFVNRNTMRNKTMKRRINEEISYGLDNDELEKELDDMDASDDRSTRSSSRKSRLQNKMSKRKELKDKSQREKDDICVQISNILSKIVSYKDIIDEYVETYNEIRREFSKELGSMNGIWKLYLNNLVVFKNIGDADWKLELSYYNGKISWNCYIPNGFTACSVAFDEIDRLVKWLYNNVSKNQTLELMLDALTNTKLRDRSWWENLVDRLVDEIEKFSDED